MIGSLFHKESIFIESDNIAQMLICYEKKAHLSALIGRASAD